MKEAASFFVMVVLDLLDKLDILEKLRKKACFLWNFMLETVSFSDSYII